MTERYKSKNMFEKIKTAFHTNLTKEEYECIRHTVAQQNMTTLKWCSLLVSILMCLLITAISNQVFSSIAMNKSAYLIMGISSLLIYLISWLYLPMHDSATKIIFYIFLSTIMIFSIYIGVITNTNQRASTICVLLFAIPLLITDKPWHISVFMSFAIVLFCATSYQFKEYTLFMNEMLNCLCIFVISIAVNFAQQNMKYSRIRDRYIIDQNNMQLIHMQKVELEESRISIMLSQIQPHFLYNSLSSISYLCEIDPMAAQKAINDFSDYLRGNMDSLKLTKPIPFDKELEHIRIYLSLEKLRFDDELHIVYDIQTTGFRLPALTVQPLVENAVRYGVSKKEGGGTVTIATREHEDYIEIIVSDDGVGYEQNAVQEDGRTHVGIDNVRSRLAAMVDGIMEISSVKDVGTKVTIKLPKEKI